MEALLSAVNRWQDVAASFVCTGMTSHVHRRTHARTHARTAGAGRIHSELSEDGRILRSAVINGLIEVGARMGGGPV